MLGFRQIVQSGYNTVNQLRGLYLLLSDLLSIFLSGLGMLWHAACGLMMVLFSITMSRCHLVFEIYKGGKTATTKIFTCLFIIYFFFSQLSLQS